MCKDKILHNHTVTIPTQQGKSSYSLADAEYLRNANIVGAFVRHNGRSVNNRALINETARASAFLSIKHSNYAHFDQYPLNHLLYVAGITEPGSYAPISLPNGIDIGTTKITVANAAALSNNEDIEIVFITLDNC